MNHLEAKANKLVNIWNSQDLKALKELYKTDAVFYDPLLGTEIKGEAILMYAKGIYEAFPDLKFVVKDIAVSKGLAMAEWSQNGTNTGEIMGKPATGRYVEIPAVSVLRYNENGDLISHYDYWDMKKLQADLFG
ncbi:MAG: ester cyclase [Bacteroidota bacterium]